MATTATKKALAPATKKATTGSAETGARCEESSRTSSEEVCCGGALETDQGYVQEGIADYLPGRAPGCGAKAAKALLAALAQTVLASIHKNGAQAFTLPGLLKVVAPHVPAKKKRFCEDPFTGVEKWFAAKPTLVRLEARPLKKLKDAAL
jgi:hypothetical protein